MKTLIKKLNQVNKNVYSFIFILGLLLTLSSNLKAEFDTISVKDDYRIVSINHYKVMNDSMIITYIALLPYPDSLPTEEYVVRLVNFNVNSMTYTHTYELHDSSQYELHDFVLSEDKSRVLIYPREKKYPDSLVGEYYNDSLYVYNTNDGSLDSILTMPGLKFNNNIKQLSDGKAGFLAESSTITTIWDKPQKYVGQIDLTNYSSTFFPLNPDFEMYERSILNFDITKSYHDGYDKEVIIHTIPIKYLTFSIPFDSNLVRREYGIYLSNSIDSGCFWWTNTDFYITQPIYFQNDRYFVDGKMFYDSKDELNKNLYIKEHKSNYGRPMGFSLNEELIFYYSIISDSLENKVSAIIIYDFENDVNLDTMIFDPKPHPLWGVRNYDNIKFLNDSIAIGLINSGIIKFKFVLETSSVDSQENIDNYKVYPNPAGNQLNILSEKRVNNIKIIDVLGREVFNSNINSKQIDVSFLETGIYYLIINNKNTSKFIKE